MSEPRIILATGDTDAAKAFLNALPVRLDALAAEQERLAAELAGLRIANGNHQLWIGELKKRVQATEVAAYKPSCADCGLSGDHHANCPSIPAPAEPSEEQIRWLSMTFNIRPADARNIVESLISRGWTPPRTK